MVDLGDFLQSYLPSTSYINFLAIFPFFDPVLWFDVRPLKQPASKVARGDDKTGQANHRIETSDLPKLPVDQMFSHLYFISESFASSEFLFQKPCLTWEMVEPQAEPQKRRKRTWSARCTWEMELIRMSNLFKVGAGRQNDRLTCTARSSGQTRCPSTGRWTLCGWCHYWTQTGTRSTARELLSSAEIGDKEKPPAWESERAHEGAGRCRSQQQQSKEQEWDIASLEKFDPKRVRSPSSPRGHRGISRQRWWKFPTSSLRWDPSSPRGLGLSLSLRFQLKRRRTKEEKSDRELAMGRRTCRVPYIAKWYPNTASQRQWREGVGNLCYKYRSPCGSADQIWQSAPMWPINVLVFVVVNWILQDLLLKGKLIVVVLWKYEEEDRKFL